MRRIARPDRVCAVVVWAVVVWLACDSPSPLLCQESEGDPAARAETQVDFTLPHLIKTGYSLEGTRVRPLTKFVMLRCRVKTKAATVSLAMIGSDAAKAELGALNRNVNDGTVVIGVMGRSPSTATSVTQIEVIDGNTRVALADVRVVIPKTQTHSVAAATMINTSDPPAGGATWLKSKASAIVSITVNDQFGERLDSVYNGSRVVEEMFTNGTGFFQGGTGVWGTITAPTATLANGVKQDEAANSLRRQWSAALTADEPERWAAGTLMLNGRNNLFSLSGTDVEGTATQAIRVWGHVLDNTFDRVVRTRAENHPPVPHTVTDTATPP